MHKAARHSVRLSKHDYSEPAAYFLTLCTHDRDCLFGEIDGGEMHLNEYGGIVQTVRGGLIHRFPNADMDSFVIMPNHVHGIIQIRSSNVGAIHELPLQPTDRRQRRNMLLPKIVGYFKMNAAKQINEMRQTPGIPVWQCNYYEHVIRNENELNRYREYIRRNVEEWESDENNISSARNLAKNDSGNI